jgi:putative cardiolipin synthase
LDETRSLIAESWPATCRIGRTLAGTRAIIAAALVASALLGAGCASMPPGMDGPKPASTALADPGKTTLGKRFAARENANKGLSGFRLLIDGTDTFALHLEIAEKAERTLDVQYFLLREDDTGKLLLESLLRAADRGVRVRMLIDDAEAFEADSKIRPLAAHPNIEIRIFNPFIVRRELTPLRWAEFVVGSRRLNYRMHNKLFIGDNAVALTGGRNVGDAYYQASNKVELGDFDLLVVGPMVQALSQSFDLYWNDRLAIPAARLLPGAPTQEELDKTRQVLASHREKMADSEYVRSLPKTKLLDQLLSGKVPLVWARASIAYDLPDKAKTASEAPGRFMWERVAAAVEETQRELIIVTPYLVPGESEMALIRRLRERGVRVRILTNSLASTDMPVVHVGYMKYREPLLEAGCELYEVRPMLGKPQDGHGTIKSGSSEHFGLHAKVFVIDRRRAFVGSMNFDQRSLDINTEIGVIIDSPKIAADIASRFEAIVQPANSYQLALESASTGRSIQWITEVDGKPIRFDADPDVDAGKRAVIRMLSLLPIDGML